MQFLVLKSVGTSIFGFWSVSEAEQIPASQQREIYLDICLCAFHWNTPDYADPRSLVLIDIR